MYLSCNNITMGYENTLALDDVSFQVDKGDFLSVLGANGSGKNTFKNNFRLIAGKKRCSSLW
ncbi:MAG: hypothetical protein RR219_04645 [Clostridiales bacterium]